MIRLAARVCFFTLLIGIVTATPRDAQAQEAREVTIHLKSGEVISGKIVEYHEEVVVVETRFGEMRIDRNEIDRIEFGDDSTQDVPTTPTAPQRERGLEEVYLYDSRKKSVGTALGIQLLGGGLVYGENYALGIPMMLIENALIIGGLFVDDPDVTLAMQIGGLGLKSINTFFTIRTVNKYNENLLYELGLLDSPESGGYLASDLVPRQAFNTIYLGIGENAVKYSINFEHEFRNNWSLRGGFSKQATFIALPISGHYMIGKQSNRFDIGAGVVIHTFEGFERPAFSDQPQFESTEVTYTDSFSYHREETRKTGLARFVSVGYKYQPVEGGFFFKANLALMHKFGYTSEFGRTYPYPGIGAGYSF